MSITFANPQRDQKYVSQYSKHVLEQCMNAAGVSSICITSTYRSPEDQARVMLANLRSGPGTMYRGPGADVEKLGKQHALERDEINRGLSHGFDPNKPLPRYTLSKAHVEELMADKIHQHETRLGSGCVSHHQQNPSVCNVIDINPVDISLSSLKKFISTLTHCPSVTRIGLPGSIQPYNPKHFRESVRCLHVEIPQGVDGPEAPKIQA